MTEAKRNSRRFYNKLRASRGSHALHPNFETERGGFAVIFGDAEDEEQAVLAARKINRRTREENAVKRIAARTSGLTVATICPDCRMLRDDCATCGGKGVVRR